MTPVYISPLYYDTILVFLPLYLLLIVSLVYRDEIGRFVKKIRRVPTTIAPIVSHTSVSTTAIAPSSASLFKHLLDELDVFLSTEAIGLHKTSVLAKVRQMVLRFPQLLGTAYQTACETHLILEAKNKLAINIRPEEAIDCWQTSTTPIRAVQENQVR